MPCKCPYINMLDPNQKYDGNCEKNEGNKSRVMQIPVMVKLEMIWIEPGTFVMGSPEAEQGRNVYEIQHEVTLTKGYWLGKYEVTQLQYWTIMGENPSRFSAHDHPVEHVSWNDAMDFCARLTEIGRRTKNLSKWYKYTLPTEAQWEYACRAGTATALNNGKNLTDKCVENGRDCPNMDEVGWYDRNSRFTTHPVGQKKPNAWGFYDMHGNVWEWCLDRYKKDHYCRTSASTDPMGPDNGTTHVLRGGCCNTNANGCRSAYRRGGDPGGHIASAGFRVALSLV